MYEGVQIESNWKLKGVNWEFSKFGGGISKKVKVQGGSLKFPPNFEKVL